MVDGALRRAMPASRAQRHSEGMAFAAFSHGAAERAIHRKRFFNRLLTAEDDLPVALVGGDGLAFVEFAGEEFEAEWVE